MSIESTCSQVLHLFFPFSVPQGSCFQLNGSSPGGVNCYFLFQDSQLIFHFLGKLLQAKGTKDATAEAKVLFQRALDLRTAHQGVYHRDTKLIRRTLMLLETSEVAARLGEKATRKERDPYALGGRTSLLSTRKTSHKNLAINQATAS